MPLERDEAREKVKMDIIHKTHEISMHGGIMAERIIDDIIDRLLIYLNYPTDFDFKKWDKRLNGIVARVAVSVGETLMHGGGEQKVLSITSYGQSVTFANEASKITATMEDDELFLGVSKLLSRFRRVNVVSRKR